MFARGRVQNGVVVLEDGARLPEGLEVMILSAPTNGEGRHSVLQIPPVSVGHILHPLTSEDDLLDEMLQGRP